MFSIFDIHCGLGGVSAGFTEAGFQISAAFDDAYWLSKAGYSSDEKRYFFLENGNNQELLNTQENTVLVVSKGDVGLIAKIVDKALTPACAFVVENIDPASSDFNDARSIIELHGYDSVVFHLDAAYLGVPQTRKMCYWVGLFNDTSGKKLEKFLKTLRNLESALPAGVRASSFYEKNRCEHYFLGARADLVSASVLPTYLPVPELATRDLTRTREGYNRQLFDAGSASRAIEMRLSDLIEINLGGPIVFPQDENMFLVLQRSMPVGVAKAIATALLSVLEPVRDKFSKRTTVTQFDNKRDSLCTKSCVNHITKIVDAHRQAMLECETMTSMNVRTNGTRVICIRPPTFCMLCDNLTREILGNNIPPGWIFEIRERKNNRFKKDDFYIRSPPGENAVVLRSRLSFQSFSDGDHNSDTHEHAHAA